MSLGLKKNQSRQAPKSVSMFGCYMEPAANGELNALFGVPWEWLGKDRDLMVEGMFSRRSWRSGLRVPAFVDLLP